MSALRPGVLSYRAKDHTGVVAVGQGFLQVAPMPQAGESRDRVLVLVDQALTAADVDRAAAEKRSGRRRPGARGVEGGARRRLPRASHAPAWAQARLDAAGRAAPH